MNGTNVSLTVLERLTEEWDALTPEAQKAARYVLENPADVGVSTVREIAEAAFRYQQQVEKKEKRIVGVNCLVTEEEPPLPILKVDETVERDQIARLRASLPRAAREGPR